MPLDTLYTERKYHNGPKNLNLNLQRDPAGKKEGSRLGFVYALNGALH